MAQTISSSQTLTYPHLRVPASLQGAHARY